METSSGDYTSISHTIYQNKVGGNSYAVHYKTYPSFMKIHFFHNFLNKGSFYSIVSLAHVQVDCHVALFSI